MTKKLTLLFASFSFISIFSQEIMDNSKVIEMKTSNLSMPIIINAIDNATDYNFDITTKGLKQLSENKVDDDIVVLIMKKQKNKSENIVNIDGIQIDKDEYGLFINENNVKIKINSHLTQVDMGIKMKAIIPNANSDVTISNSTNIFYLNFNSNEDSATNSVYNFGNSISDPNEGELVKLSKNGKKREFQVGKVGMGGIKTEIPEKIRIEYKVEKLKHTIYKITTNKKLEPGEYGFIFGAISPGTTLKIYDFTVK